MLFVVVICGFENLVGKIWVFVMIIFYFVVWKIEVINVLVFIVWLCLLLVFCDLWCWFYMFVEFFVLGGWLFVVVSLVLVWVFSKCDNFGFWW